MAEGAIALLAAVLLFTASYWLLSRLEVERWLGFVRRSVEGSLESGRGMTLFAISFLAVYREAFETVLFLQALIVGRPGAGAHVLLGVFVGALGLALVVWALFKVGAKLPLKPFFAASSAVLGVLSFVLAGQGIYSLQQAGILSAQAVALPSIPSLGIHPSVPGLAVQGLIVALFALATLQTVFRSRGRASLDANQG